MPRFLTGDELGNIKSLNYLPSSRADSKATVTTLFDGDSKGKERAVQKLALSTSSDIPLVRGHYGSMFSDLTYLEEKLAVARTDGSASVSRLQPGGLEILREWTEPRLKTGQRYVGLAASSSASVVSSKAFYVSFGLIIQQGLFLHFEWRPPLHTIGRAWCRTPNRSIAHASV
jgi:ribosome biogenesis protein NSA1